MSISNWNACVSVPVLPTVAPSTVYVNPSKSTVSPEVYLPWGTWIPLPEQSFSRTIVSPSAAASKAASRVSYFTPLISATALSSVPLTDSVAFSEAGAFGALSTTGSSSASSSASALGASSMSPSRSVSSADFSCGFSTVVSSEPCSSFVKSPCCSSPDEGAGVSTSCSSDESSTVSVASASASTTVSAAYAVNPDWNSTDATSIIASNFLTPPFTMIPSFYNGILSQNLTCFFQKQAYILYCIKIILIFNVFFGLLSAS